MRLAPAVPATEARWVAIGSQRVVVRQNLIRGRHRNVTCYMGYARRGRETMRCGHTHFNVKRARLCATTLTNQLNRTP